MFLRITRWLLYIVLLMMALVFFVSLAINLAQEGNLKALPAALPSSAEFTAEYLSNVVRGDMGVIASEHRAIASTPVLEDLARALPKSLGLLAFSLLLGAGVGLILGIRASVKRSNRFSGILLFGSVLGTSTPSFFAAMLLIWLAGWLYRASGQQIVPVSGFGWDAHLILPALVLAARPAAAVTRLSYNTLTEIFESDYIRTATGKGLFPPQILRRHVLRNAGIPLLTAIAVSLRFSLAILPIVEYIFNWPGIGMRLLESIQIQDTVAVIGMTLPLILLFILVNLLLEFLYPLVDPRLRTSEVGAV